MSDWDNIPNLVNDSKTDVPGMNLIGAQVVNDTDFLFIRMIYAGAYEYPLLWGNVTLRNSAEDVFVLMAFVSTDFTQQDTWIFPGTDIDNPRNDPSQPETYTQYLNYSAVSLDYTSIEFKIPLADIDSGNPANMAEIDLVFWHFDAFQASLSLSYATENDRAPDTGFVTYYPGLGPGEIDETIESKLDLIDTTTSTPTNTSTPSPIITTETVSVTEPKIALSSET